MKTFTGLNHFQQCLCNLFIYNEYKSNEHAQNCIVHVNDSRWIILPLIGSQESRGCEWLANKPDITKAVIRSFAALKKDASLLFGSNKTNSRAIQTWPSNERIALLFLFNYQRYQSHRNIAKTCENGSNKSNFKAHKRKVTLTWRHLGCQIENPPTSWHSQQRRDTSATS